MERFLERNHNVSFNIVTALRRRRSAPESSSPKCGVSAATAKKRFEEVAETGAVKFKFNTTISAAVTIISAARLLRAPIGWRLEASGLIPIRAQLIVFLPLLRIAQYLIRFVDLFEFLLGGFFVLRHIRMVLARQFPECALDFVV